MHFTDNRPPFSSEDLTKFMAKQHIKHITTSPLYLKSNGFIKGQIKAIKTALATTYHSPTSRPTTPNTIDQYLTYIAATNDQQPRVIASQTDADTSFSTSTPSSPTTSKTSTRSSTQSMSSSTDSNSAISTVNCKWQAAKTLYTHQL